MIGRSRGRPCDAVLAVCMPSAGSASAIRMPAASDGRDHRAPQDAVEDRAPDARLAVVAMAAPRDERHAALLDLVAELGQQRGEHGERAEDGDARRRGSCRRANDMNTLLPAKNMPAMAIITVMPEIEHGAAGGRRGDLERGLGERPASRSSISRRR